MQRGDGDEQAAAQGGGVAEAPAAAAAAVPGPAAQGQQAAAPAAGAPAGAVAIVTQEQVSTMMQFMKATVASVKDQKALQAQQQLNQVTKQENKEFARLMLAVATRKEESERTLLACAAIDAIRLLEQDATDIEEPNKALRAVLRRFKGLTSEEQEDLFDTIKLRKRTGCTHCGRSSHASDKCFSKTHVVTGEPINAPMAHKRPRHHHAQGEQQQQQQQHYAGGGGYGPGGYGPPAQGYGPQQPYYNGGGGGGPAYSQQRQRPSFGGMCWNCETAGHRENDCPHPRRQRGPQGGPAPAPRPAGSQVREPQDIVQPAEGTCTGEQETASAEKECPVRIEPMADAALLCSVMPVCVVPMDSESVTEIDESFADQYVEGALHWAQQDRQEPEQQNPKDMMNDVTPALASSASQHSASAAARLYQTSHESGTSDTYHQSSSVNPDSRLHDHRERASTLQRLEREGREIMPLRAGSLRAAIGREFEGKKKVLSDEEVMRQTCVRCKKTGHTAYSCPDQTQMEETDRGEKDAWVRRLLELPRVDIAAENTGVSLEEGVARWQERGEKYNRGNPWLGSTKMEDSLKKRLGYHKAMGMSSVHLGWIGFGVPLQFIEQRHPRPLAFRNHASAMEEEEFIDKEHRSNLADGSYVKVSREQLKGICPLQVVKHPVSGKKRLVQDLRWINGHLPNVQFRMESLHKELGDVVQRGDKMLTTDIAKAYYCLAMHPDAQQYLGWEWKGEYYMPTCLVFGLAPAPRIFTKIMRPMMAFMRSLGVRVLGMIDDYLWAEREERILSVRTAVQTVLPLLGWSFNAKCEWDPADEVLMLGMLVNAKEFQVRATEKKVNATLANIGSILQKQRALVQKPVRIVELQEVTGRLMSMMLALRGVRVFTRSLYGCLAEALERNEKLVQIAQPRVWTVQLTKGAVEELEFWQTRLLTHNGLRINCRESQVQVVLWSDASDVGWGGEAAGVEARVPAADVQVPSTPVTHMAHGALPFQEIRRSSTRRELIALQKVAATPRILEQIQGKRILVVMDSVPALRNLIKGGGPVPELCAAVADWQRFCEGHNIEAEYEWVERAKNWRADEASKLDSQQHTLRQTNLEESIRRQLDAMPATQWRSRNNHFKYGKVPLFLPQFHQVDARIEMIRAQLEEAIIVVPRWPAGGNNHWWRRLGEHSIARVAVGQAAAVYKEKTNTGHNDELEAFWLMGRRGEKQRQAAMARAGEGQ